MTKHNLISIDLAKNVFQVCGMTKNQKITFNKSIGRVELTAFICQQEPTTIAMEACYSSHYWARTFEAFGHKVLMLPAQHVKPFVRGNKSDHNDAIAIAEAALRPNIKAVPIKSLEQQDIQVLHRLRERYVSQRTALISQARGLLSEYGIISPLGLAAFCRLLRGLVDIDSKQLSAMIKDQMRLVADEYYTLTDRINQITTKLKNIAQKSHSCQLLLSIPGIGPINATAIFSAIKQGQQFKNAREFAVWLGLTPKQASSGERQTTSGISKRGNGYLRKQLVHGARSAISRCQKKDDQVSRWANQLVARRGIQKATVAMAARMARTAWVLLNRDQEYIAY